MIVSSCLTNVTVALKQPSARSRSSTIEIDILPQKYIILLNIHFT